MKPTMKYATKTTMGARKLPVANRDSPTTPKTTRMTFQTILLYYHGKGNLTT